MLKPYINDIISWLKDNPLHLIFDLEEEGHELFELEQFIVINNDNDFEESTIRYIEFDQRLIDLEAGTQQNNQTRRDLLYKLINEEWFDERYFHRVHQTRLDENPFTLKLL